MILFDVLETKSTRNCGFEKHLLYVSMHTQLLEMDIFSLFLKVIKSERRDFWNHFFSHPKLIDLNKTKTTTTKKQAPRNCVSVAYNLNLMLFNIRTPSHLFCSSFIPFYWRVSYKWYQLLISLSHRSDNGLRVVSGKHSLCILTSPYREGHYWQPRTMTILNTMYMYVQTN